MANIGLTPAEVRGLPIAPSAAALLTEAVWIGSSDLRRTDYVNASFEKLFGRSADDMYELPQRLLDGIHPDDRDRLLMAMAGQSPAAHVAIRIVNPNGSQREVEVHTLLGESGLGRGPQVIVFADVATRLGDNELSVQAGQMARLGGWELDVKTMQSSWTSPLFDMLEIPEGEAPEWGQGINLYHRDDQPVIAAAIQDALENGVPYDLELRGVTAKGKPLHVRTAGIPVVVDGKIVRLEGYVQDITERVETESALRRSEALVTQAGRMARLGGWELDVETSQSVWSRAVFEMFEVPEDQAPALAGGLDLYHRDDRPVIAAAVQDALENGVPYDLELRAVTARGNPFHIRAVGVPVVVDGKIVRLEGYVQDITERVDNESALRRSEALATATGRMAQLGGWELDAETLEITWTEPVFDIFEVPESEPPTLEDAILYYHPDDRPVIAAAVRDALENGVPYDLELRIITAEGTSLFVRTTGQPQVENGVVVKVTGFLFDITARVESQRELARMDAILSESGRIAGFGGWELEAETLRGWWSKAVFDLFELPEGTTPLIADGLNFYHPEDKPVIDAAVKEALQNGTPYDLELRAVTAKGKHIHIRTGGQPVLEDGVVVKLTGFVQDVTSRYKQEVRLQTSLTATIEAMVHAIEARDPYTATHQRRVAQLAAAIGRDIGLSREDINAVFLGSMIHDIGKISVPAEILNKPGRLRALEFELVKGHSQVGYEILCDIDYPWPVAEIVQQHHERLDGSGYPDGRRGDEISRLAQIVAVADVVEAMTAHRPYRPALGLDAALDEITTNRGTLYSQDAVDSCVHLFRDLDFDLDVVDRPEMFGGSDAPRVW